MAGLAHVLRRERRASSCCSWRCRRGARAGGGSGRRSARGVAKAGMMVSSTVLRRDAGSCCAARKLGRHGLGARGQRRCGAGQLDAAGYVHMLCAGGVDRSRGAHRRLERSWENSGGRRLVQQQAAQVLRRRPWRRPRCDSEAGPAHAQGAASPLWPHTAHTVRPVVGYPGAPRGAGQ